MTGDEDTLCMPEGTDRFHRLAASTDKSVKHYPHCRHEILNEPERGMVLEDILSWINERM